MATMGREMTFTGNHATEANARTRKKDPSKEGCSRARIKIGLGWGEPSPWCTRGAVPRVYPPSQALTLMGHRRCWSQTPPTQIRPYNQAGHTVTDTCKARRWCRDLREPPLPPIKALRAPWLSTE